MQIDFILYIQPWGDQQERLAANQDLIHLIFPGRCSSSSPEGGVCSCSTYLESVARETGTEATEPEMVTSRAIDLVSVSSAGATQPTVPPQPSSGSRPDS
jgi:hypothetical protein